MGTARSRWNVAGIQWRVGLLVGLGAVVSMLVPGWIAWRSIDALKDRVLLDRQGTAATVAKHMEGVVAREWSRLQEVAAGPGIAAARPDDVSTAQVLTGLRHAYLHAEVIHHAYVTNHTGLVRWQEPAASDLTGRELPGAREAVAAGRPTVTALVSGPNGQAVFLYVPIRSWDGVVSGLVAGEVDPKGSRLVALLRQYPIEADGSVDLIDPSGVIGASSDPTRQGAASDHRQLLAGLIRSGGSTRGTCHSCHAGAARTTDLMAFVSIKGLPWGARVREPESAALAQTQTRQMTLLALAPMLLGLALLFAYGAAQSLLRPLGILTRAAERIASGDMDLAIPDLGSDEVGRLGRALEHMRSTLQSSMQIIGDDNATLERRVEARTRELEGLYRQLAERDEARSRLLRQVITAQEDERKRLARELHDDTCQTISALNMRLETAVARLPEGASNAPLLEAKALAVRTLDELHRLIYDLRPSVLDDLGLWSAIRWYADRQLAQQGVTVRCEFSDVDRRLPPLMETALFRAAQESISNIAKHAHAEQVLVQCGIDHDVLTIEIEDDGNGFELSQVRRPTDEGHGWGLLGITERVEALGGRVDIDTAPGQGARVVITVRVPAEDARG